MLREHPVRILRYTRKYLWLLIFPILRGAYHFATTEDIFRWLRGTWIDLLVLFLILGFGWLVWFCRKFTIESNQLYVTDGFIVRRRRYMPLRNLAAMTIEHPVLLRPLGVSYVSVDAASGLLDTADIRLVIRHRDEEIFRKAIPHMRTGKRHSFRHAGGIWRVLLFSVIFSSGFSGAMYLALFWFQSGRIARDLLQQFQITERLNVFSEEVASRLMGIPPAAVSIGLVIVFLWVFSFLRNVLRYGGFEMQSDQRIVFIKSGLLTRRSFWLVNRKINFIDMRQNLLTKLCRIFSVAVNIPGYGNQQGSIPVCMPILTAGELNDTVPMLFPSFRLTHRTLKPTKDSWYGYICIPLYAGLCVFPAIYFAKRFFPSFSDLFDFLQLMLFIPIVWKIIIQIVSFQTTGMSVSEGRICVRYCEWTTFHTIIADTDTVVKVRIERQFWHFWTGKCHVVLQFQSEVNRSCHLWCMNYQEACEALEALL
ncbi:MAG: PH domain-containing protein [Oscillospiraceae bacterium]|nr:PH domain-containing protein [Oscillospiraceae bacterium]